SGGRAGFGVGNGRCPGVGHRFDNHIVKEFAMNTMKRKYKGAAMVEYAVLLGAVLLVGILAMSMIGHKTGDILGAIAVILPGTHTDDNANVTSAHLIETT